jgi:hypothetical protein
MNPKQTRIIAEKVRQVHHVLADVITTMDLAVDISPSLSRAEKAKYEQYWREAHLKAIQDLQESLVCLSQPTGKVHLPCVVAPLEKHMTR